MLPVCTFMAAGHHWQRCTGTPLRLPLSRCSPQRSADLPVFSASGHGLRLRRGCWHAADFRRSPLFSAGVMPTAYPHCGAADRRLPRLAAQPSPRAHSLPVRLADMPCFRANLFRQVGAARQWALLGRHWLVRRRHRCVCLFGALVRRFRTRFALFSGRFLLSEHRAHTGHPCCPLPSLPLRRPPAPLPLCRADALHQGFVCAAGTVRQELSTMCIPVSVRGAG